MLHRHRGFTLLELLVVIAIIALATAGVALSLRGNTDQPLEQEAQRLSSLLEAARAQSRASDSPIWWRPTAQGYAFVGAPAASDSQDDLQHPRPWLAEGLAAQIESPAGASTLVLGPEPIIPAQVVALRLGERVLRIGSDGVQPFAVLDVTGGPP